MTGKRVEKNIFAPFRLLQTFVVVVDAESDRWTLNKLRILLINKRKAFVSWKSFCFGIKLCLVIYLEDDSSEYTLEDFPFSSFQA